MKSVFGFTVEEMTRGRHPHTDVNPADPRGTADRQRGPRALAARWRLLDARAPRLIDTVSRVRVQRELDSLSDTELARGAGLAYAAARSAEIVGDVESAVRWYTIAQERVAATQKALAARIAFELGYLYLAQGRPAAADVVLAWGERRCPISAAWSDLEHLRALIEHTRGNQVAAMGHLRAAIRASGSALTPLTEVLAMANLAAVLNQRDAREAFSIAALAFRRSCAQRLDRRIAPSILNIQSFALIVMGDLRRAGELAETVIAEARTLGNQQTELHAKFNLAIAKELGGEREAARALLEDVAGDAARRGLDELYDWSRLRLAWLDLDHNSGEFLARSSNPWLGAGSAMLQALGLLRVGNLTEASRELRRLRLWFAEQGDALSEFAVLMWLATAEERALRTSAARRTLASARQLAIAGGFRASPNWWSADLVDAAGRIEGSREIGFASTLLRTPFQLSPASGHLEVTVDAGGAVSVAGRRLGDDDWREGRTGPGVLRKLFATLAKRGPGGVSRDELIDQLWPESDGDRALKNFHSAMHDLRRLAGRFGISVIRETDSYHLS